MKRFSILILLLALGIFAIGIGKAETEKIRGKIEMSIPNTPTPKVEVNLDKSFFNLFIKFTLNLPALSEYAEMIDGAFIRGYDRESGNFAEMTRHYKQILKTEEWNDLIKVKDKLHVSLLFTDEPGVLHGIFISFTDEHTTTFVNIFGKIDFQKLGILFGKIRESQPDILKNIKMKRNLRYKLHED